MTSAASRPTRPHRSGAIRGGVVVVVLVALGLAWRLTPLSEWVSPEGLSTLARPVREASWGPLVAFGAFAIGGTLMVPITALIVANALVFDTGPALTAAIPGVLLSATLGFAAGHALWREAVDRMSGGRFEAVNRALAERGPLPMAVLRLVPVAPFAVVNLIAGASRIRFRDYIAGTALTMVPGTVAMTLGARGVAGAVRDPSPVNVTLALALLIGIFGGGRFVVGWARRRGRDEGTAESLPHGELT